MRYTATKANRMASIQSAMLFQKGKRLEVFQPPVDKPCNEQVEKERNKQQYPPMTHPEGENHAAERCNGKLHPLLDGSRSHLGLQFVLEICSRNRSSLLVAIATRFLTVFVGSFMLSSDICLIFI